MNAQEIFDTAVSAVIKQARPSLGQEDQCLYRGPDGLRCAVGWLIPDDKYDPSMESRGLFALLRYWPNAIGRSVSDDETLVMKRLQQAHDQADRQAFVDDFKRRARAVAENFGLNPRAAE